MVTISLESGLDHMSDISIVGYTPPQLTEIQNQLKLRLTTVGFACTVYEHTSKGGGLWWLDEDPTEVKSWHIKVSW